MVWLEGLSEIEILHGVFVFVQTLIYFYVGVRIFLKYFAYKNKTLLTAGGTWIFLSSAWWGAAISFIVYLFIGSGLSPFWYFFFCNAFTPLAMMLWIYTFGELNYPKKKVLLLIIYGIICVPFEIVLIYLLILDPANIGVLQQTFFYSPTLLTMLFQVFALSTGLITGILFAKKSLQTTDEKIRLKGKFLLMAFVVFSLGGIIDAAAPLTAVTIVIVRLVLIFAAIMFYIGFLMPEKIAKRLIKNK